MPGIAGLIGTGSSEEHRTALDRMVKRMTHERFQTSDIYVNERLGLWVGWVSHKDSFSGCLPVWNARKDIGLIFSGENFQDKSEIDNLRTQCHDVELGNPSYLLHLYEEIGIEFLERLNGWFSGVLVNLRDEKIVLFNDRYGLGRIYFHETADAFYFSSEAKSLLRVLPRVRELDLSSLAEFCSFGCVLQNRTLFHGVSLLPGASRWTLSRNQPAKKEVYFRKESWENQSPLNSEEFYRQLKETFARILPRYLRNEQRLGMSLTGGLDGRMIMAWADCPPGSLPCYTFGGSYRDCADVRVARRLAEVCHQPHQVIPVNDDFVRQFPTLAEKAVYVSDGTMDVTGSVELYVNKIAREIAPVRLTGNYGSEILRGNVAFRPSLMHEGLFESEFANRIQATAETYTHEVEGHNLSFIAFKQVPWHHFSRLSLEQSQLTLRSPYLDNDLVKLMYRVPAEFATSKWPSLRLVADGNPALSRIATDRGLVHEPIALLSRARCLYQDFTFKVEYAYDVGMPQWLARLNYVLASFHVERLFLGRHRFYHFGVWYRDELAQYLKDILLDTRTRQRPYLRGECLEEIVNGHIRGNRNYTTQIHKVLTLELIQRQLVERNWN
jgi:asparagine synthase (glutamine-hydrolysing)